MAKHRHDARKFVDGWDIQREKHNKKVEKELAKEKAAKQAEEAK